MSHVPVLLWKRVVLFEKGWWFDLSTALIGPHVQCALGVEKRVLPKKLGAWFLGFDFFSWQEPNINNKHFPCARKYFAKNFIWMISFKLHFSL